ncbi:nuclear transport factor 2 family protein [Aetokthonos hydrillicola Thurmond2011]|jgi:hypothetical protein|uniref:Nuclear transport factor 2 family protein n=1 Tax=Aetokthonos hydrillicola Thurmond2011 TaxID=2712845 RepID=A0AAP5IDB9_9CYAN|nr:nuclear transport factor 2 family protein [Aetokthonos hydrillicola]MBO3459730.1 nuclear transport factor 2 family protein [Aetokthonos hydrillicola CCALA 1050]MBW4585162.1 nuclear transport factor 2 family protein [Aetokthonos hydrillicola CCALA 1050]MDR9899501.1 nuclear transport factor 2 family protein [Aetokthonos hydrillicola Thurmond2011]
MERGKNNRVIASRLIPRVFRSTTLTPLIAVLVLLLGGMFEFTSASEPSTFSDIAQLTSCYALGTDAIGRGEIQQGKNIYQNCFTTDATITAIFPDGTTVTKVGTNSWADYVASVFQGNGYTATQHLIGTINTTVTGDTAKMSSYLQATHKRSDTSIDVANGTYEDEVIKQNGIWKIRSRTLKLITFLNLSSPNK